MKRRLLSAVLMAAVALVLMGCFGTRQTGDAVTDYARYFRDNTEYAGKSTLICYAETPYAEGRSFDGESLLAAGVIPEMPEYSECSGWANYYADGSFFEIGVTWQYAPEDYSSYKQLTLTIIPGEIGDPDMRDGFFQPDEKQVTETEVDGVTVYGSGTAERDEALGQCNVLVFTKDGVRYQIEGIRDTTLEELGRVLDFCLAGGVDLDAFSMERGNEYTWSDTTEWTEFFSDCLPDVSGLPVRQTQDVVTVKNGEPQSASLVYTDTELEDDGGARLYWDVTADPAYYDLTGNLGALAELTQEDIQAALETNHEVGFYVGALCIHVSAGTDVPAATVLAAIASLPDFPGGAAAGE